MCVKDMCSVCVWELWELWEDRRREKMCEGVSLLEVGPFSPVNIF